MYSKIKGPAIIFILIIVLNVSCKNSRIVEIHGPESMPADTLPHVDTCKPVLLFGIPADSFNLVTGEIKRNGFLSQILIEHGVSMQEIDQVSKNFDTIFDVRKIRSGNHYTVFCEPDSTARARYLVYEHDPTICYIFSFNDSLNITPYRKEIKKVIKYSSGTIETSMWESIMMEGYHPSLAIALSEIFAWTVDFFGLQKGDSYKVIYEELFIEDVSMGIGNIYGAQFTWAGNTISAIPFLQDGKSIYFDPDGNSLQKAFLKAPLHFSRISSRFSGSRMHPILRIRRPHYGVDYAAPVGTPVHAIGDGRVAEMRSDNVNGKMIKITHNSVYSTAYLHLSRFEEGIVSGGFVRQGDIIGYVGSTGLSTGPHLDFRFYKNGSPVDPLKVEAPPVEPVSEENLERFNKIKLVVLSLLETC